MAKVFRKAFKQKVSFRQALKGDNYLSRVGGGRHPEQGEKQEQVLKEYNSRMLCPEVGSNMCGLGAQAFMGTTWDPIQTTMPVS